MIQEVKTLQTQMNLMSQIVAEMKKDKETATKQVKELQAAFEGFIHKIRVSLTCFLFLQDVNVVACGGPESNKIDLPLLWNHDMSDTKVQKV